MLPVPFNSTNVHTVKGQSSTLSGGLATHFIPASNGRNDTSQARPVNKTSRFASLFQQTEAPTDAVPRTPSEAQPLNKSQDVPRYKAPRNGQGFKAPPTPPVAFSDPNPKRVYMENVPYSAKKHEIIALFKGYKVESVDIPKRSDGTRRGIAYVNLATENDAKKAISQLHHTIFKGRRIRMMPAKIGANQRKGQPEVEKEAEEEQPAPPSPEEETVSPVSVSPPDTTQHPFQDHTSSLRTEIFDLACKYIVRGMKPSEIFAEVNFNDEEKIMIRDFHYKHKIARQEEIERRDQLALLQKLDRDCSAHGIRKCLACHKDRLMARIREKREKEGSNIPDKTAVHKQSQSWGSSKTLPGQSSPEYPSHLQGDGTGAGNAGQANQIAIHGNLDQPPVHNTNAVVTAKYHPGDPFLRQHAVVPTQAGVKTHCAYFMRTGHCDFAQQGCKFSHELPPGGLAELTGQTGRRAGPHASNGGSFSQSRNGTGGNTATEPAKARQPAMGAVRTKAHGIKPTPNPFKALEREDQAMIDTHKTYSPSVASHAGRKIPSSGITTETSTARGMNVAQKASTTNMFDTTMKASGNFSATGSRVLDQNVRSRRVFTNQMDATRQRLIAQLDYVRPAQDKLWRDSISWRDGLRDMSRSGTGTDGAADDEESSSDLISLSSDAHNHLYSE
ncbi:hypothetical protein ABW21_db0209326 [Orbilia brochopaga]|nr:hypothetical protein ABW21_db0209326 [Drechslerella brochopaga]